MNAGRLEPAAAGAWPPTALIVNGGVFDLENGNGQTVSSLSGTGGAITLGDGSLTVDQDSDTSFAGSIGGAGGLTKAGDGTLTLTGAETYTGGTEIDAGKLQLGTGASLAATGMLSMTGGIFDLNDNDQTLAGLSGSAGTITLGSGDLTVNQARATVFAGKISGTGSLTKSGDGCSAWAGRTATGTIVNAGILQPRPAVPGLDRRLTVNGGSRSQRPGPGDPRLRHGGAIALGAGTLTVPEHHHQLPRRHSGTGGLIAAPAR